MMTFRLKLILGSVMIFLVTSVPFVYPQEARRVGMNTTLRDFSGEIKSVQALGVRVVRVPLQWQLIRIRPGEYDWDSIDRFLKLARAKNIEVLFNIRTRFQEGVSKTGSKKDSIRVHASSVDTEAWLHFIEALAGRCRGQGVHYEIENEVNEGWGWKGTREEYLDLLEAGYDAIKKADPQAKVLPSAVGCGLLENYKSESLKETAWKTHDRWLSRILETKKFDVVNVHNYYFPDEIVANGMTFRIYLDHVRQIMKKAGVENLPLWITETGYISSPSEAKGRQDDGSPEKQARWLAEAYRQAFDSGCERIYWRLLHDRNEVYFGSMGLVDAKGTPRPAWNSLIQSGK